MVSIPVMPFGVAVGAEIDIVSVTSVNQNVGGVSGRYGVRGPLRQFTCTVGPADTPVVRAIHYTHREEWPVAVRDWGDFIFENEHLVYTADGSDFLAPLRRLIQSAVGTRYLHQRVLLPDETNPDFPVVLKVEGVALNRTDWTFDNYGIARIPNTFISSGDTLEWSGRALVPVVFLDGTLSVQVNVQQSAAGEFGVQSIPQLRLGEILEEELIERMTAADNSI